MDGFIGRAAELDRLREELARVRQSGRGSFVLMKGRRRVGKSWLVERFIEREHVRALYFLADRQRPQRELVRFAGALGQSDLPAAATVSGVTFETWEAALAFAARDATRDQPLVIVLDEFPHLVETETDKVVEASVNATWERTLSRLPVMLFLVGSDFSMMRMLTEHGRPLFDRPTLTMTVAPLTVAEVASAAGLTGAEAIDAYHVIGGFPRLALLWKPRMSFRRFLTTALTDEDAPFVATGRRILDAEFPDHVQARTVLSVIGAGERTYANISRVANVGSTNLRRSLELLERDKRVITSDTPLSTARSAETRYQISDPYLRFFLRFVDPNLGDIARRRQRSVVERIVRDWQSYVGRAVEPFVRQSIERLMPDDALPGVGRVGGYWTRTNDPEIDLVGVTDTAPARVVFIGSIKWRQDDPFGQSDLNALRLKGLRRAPADTGGVPGTTQDTALVAVSRSGFATPDGLTRRYGPDDLLAAWH